MNDRLYKVGGGILILIGILVALGIFYFYINDTLISGKLHFDTIYEGFGLLLLDFILLFIPGISFLKLKNKNKLTISSFVLSIVAIFVALFPVLIILIVAGGEVDIGGALLLFSGAILACILLGISDLFLLINWFKNKNN